MKNIFFLKNPKADPSATNTINLRFLIAETKKYKVKGLGISCCSKDWNQENQLVRRSHNQYQKLNTQLNFITSSIDKIEKERIVKEADIDKIVEASIKGVTVKELDNNQQLLSSMIAMKSENIKESTAYSVHTKRKFKSCLSILEEFETKAGYQISADLLNKSALSVQNDIVTFFRKKGRKDSTIKSFLTVSKGCIQHYNDYTGNKINTFNIRSTKWNKAEKQIVFLNRPELKKLYDFVFNPDTLLIPTPAELRNLKYFLFRCFCGMRVGEMHIKNINPDKLKRNSKTFTFFQDKGTKEVTVYCIGDYLVNIAESINWEFPAFASTDTALFSYSNRETATVRKYLGRLLVNEPRKIQHITEAGYHNTDFISEVTTHTPRKTFAHLIYKISNDIMLVKNQLGHTKIETTQRYLGIDLENNVIDFKKIDLGF